MEGGKQDSRSTDLSGDLASEILQRLPVKAVVRFSCVSKLWHGVVADRHFQHTQLIRRYLPDSRRVLVLTRKDDVTTMNLSKGALAHIVASRPYRYANTCNGLLCFPSSNYSEGSVLLCNPIIGELVALPKASAVPLASSSFSFEHLVGLGFNPSNREYKVVRVCYSEGEVNSKSAVAEVFAIGSPGSWRQISTQGIHLPPQWKSTYVHGAGRLYWINRKSSNPERGRIISSFYVGSEVFETLPHRQCGPNAFLAELGRQLSLIDASSPHRLSVWVLKDPIRSSWEQECVLSFRAELLPPINLWERDGALLMWLESCWVLYDRKTKRQITLWNGKLSSAHYWDWEVCSGYRESLVSLRAYDCGAVECSRIGVSFARGERLSSCGLPEVVADATKIADALIKLLPDCARASSSRTLESMLIEARKDAYGAAAGLGNAGCVKFSFSNSNSFPFIWGM